MTRTILIFSLGMFLFVGRATAQEDQERIFLENFAVNVPSPHERMFSAEFEARVEHFGQTRCYSRCYVRPTAYVDPFFGTFDPKKTSGFIDLSTVERVAIRSSVVEPKNGWAAAVASSSEPELETWFRPCW